MYGKAMELSTWAQKQLAKASQQALQWGDSQGDSWVSRLR